MEIDSQPAFANGKICYIEIPAFDIQESSKFYQKVFKWNIREDNGGNISFDDTAGQVSGMWVLDRVPSTNPGILISIMVHSFADTMKLILENNGKIVQAPEKGASEVIARFADPAGNVFCLYQDQQSLNRKQYTTKWIKWFLGIVLAGIITLVPANFIMHRTGKVDMNNLTSFQYWIQFLTVPSIAFGLFLFLACAFVPIQKKYAGILVFTLSIVFMALGTYQHYTDDGYVRSDYIIRYIGFTVCLIIGYLLSYKFFGQRKWTSR